MVNSNSSAATAKDEPRPADSDDLLSEIHVLANLISRAFAGRLEQNFDLSVAEWRVMLTLGRHPGLTAAEITSRWAMDKMAISRAIQRLEAAGHVQRTRNPDDRRSFRLSLTDAGKSLHGQVLPMAHERYRAFLSCLSRDEAATLRQAVKKLISYADDIEE